MLTLLNHYWLEGAAQKAEITHLTHYGLEEDDTIVEDVIVIGQKVQTHYFEFYLHHN